MTEHAPPLDIVAQNELTESLLKMNLLERGETPSFELLTGGVSSLIVLVRTSRGPLCIKRALPKLKVEAEWLVRIERNLAEVNWMRAATSLIPECAPRVLGQDPENFTFAMEFLDPQSYWNWKSHLGSGLVDLDFARSVAIRLARIHASMAGKAEQADLFNDDDTFSALRLDPYYIATSRVHSDCAAALLNLVEVTRKNKRTLVHGDVSPKNILGGPRGPVFLDAETAWYGDPAFDLAFCLNHLLLKSVWRPEKTDEYLAAFGIVSDIYLARVTWEPKPELEARAAALLAGNLLARIDGKSPVEYLTAERDKNFVRRFAKDALLNPEARLNKIGDRWLKERRNAM